MSWKDLDIKQKAELIKLGVLSGIRDIKLIRLLYNDINTPTLVVDLSYNETNVKPLLGIERIKQDYGIPEEEVNKANDIIQLIEKEISLEEINNQLPILFRLFKNGGKVYNPPFMQRILNNDNRSVADWENPNRTSTHKLSYALTDEGYIIYPEVQIVDGQIHDFTDPKYNHGKWDALDNAIRNSDTLRFSTEEQALRYTQEYKNKYPEYFKQFNKGGFISNNPTLALVNKVKKYDEGGLKDSNIILDYIFNGPLKRKKENSLEYRQALFNNVDPRNGYPSPWTAVKYYNTVVDALNAGDTSKKWETDGSIGQETAAAGWAKFLDLPYNKLLFPVWNGDTVRLSPELEREIPIDTNLLKLDIQRIIYDRNLDRSMGIFDREEAYKTLLLTKQLALNNLRKTYKTGEWVQMNEFMGNSVNPFDWNEDYVSPLNVLLFYGLKYDKNTNSMLYGDLYNLNAFDYFLPGNPFIIRGSIPLDKKKNGGFIFPTKTLTNKVNKFREGGHEDGDENTIYTAGYSEPITVTAKKEISKKQQMEADEEWREYLKQHPIQIGSEEYNRLPEKAKAQVYKNNWISKRTIKENPLLQYSTNYFKNKTGLYTPFYIDLSDKKVLYIDKNTNNVESILGNEFYELRNPNTVRYKKDFINTQDTLLGDRNIPLSKINTFYGIEDGKLKVGDIDVFKDNTIIIPNRSKNYGKLSKIIVKEPYKIPKLTRKERKKAIEKSRRYVEFVKNNILQKYGIELSTRDIKDPLSIKDKEIQLHVINIRNDFYTGYTENPIDRYSSLYGVTVNNDTIPIKINATPKVFFGNEQGNSIFVSNLSDQDILYKVNEFLKHNPSIPIMIDNGRFSHFILNPTEISQYSGVTPSEKLTMIGTVYKDGGFLFPNLAFSHKFDGGGLLNKQGKKRHYTEPIESPIIPKALVEAGDKEDTVSIPFLAEWLNNRRALLYENMRDTGKSSSSYNEDPEDKKGFTVKTEYDRPITDIFDSRREMLNKEYYRQIENAASAREDVLNGYTGNIQAVYLAPDYFTGRGHKIATLLDTSLSSKLHERVHAMNATPLEYKIADIIGKSMDTKDYKTNPKEVYARLMLYRYENKLNPSQIIDSEYLNNHKKELHNLNLDIFSLELLLKLFNEVAYYGNLLENYNLV